MNTDFNRIIDTELENEKWKAIEGYDGLYEVSSLGRVRSLKFGKVRVLRPGKTNKGYLTVSLFKDKKKKSVYVHRLVADAFIPNDDESKIYINHIDECKQNNRVSNLEYCTAQYNLTYNNIRRRCRENNSKRYQIKPLYDPNLSYRQNIEIFRANGIECCEWTVKQLRKDLGLSKPRKKTN